MPVLYAANTGAALDAAGVEALSTLRASAKRSGAEVGRFGVGFAAVLAVSDEPAVLSRTGGVRWSKADTRSAVTDVAPLAAELRRRGGAVPVLRLPFDAEGDVPPGFDTVVVLPLRDAGAVETARASLEAVDPTLLLVLPGLDTVEVELDGRARQLSARRSAGLVELSDAAAVRTWRVVRRSGVLAPELLAGRPTEEHERPQWEVMWALPVSHDGLPEPRSDGAAPVVHAPTPTDEPSTLGPLLVASFPLDPARRHVPAGPLRDFLVGQAAELYAELVTDLAVSTGAAEVLRLVPVGPPAGELDALLREAVLQRLRDAAFLPAAEDRSLLLRPRSAVTVDVDAGALEAVVPVLTDVLPGLLPSAWASGTCRPALRAVGVRQLTVGELVELVTTLGDSRPPRWWGGLYAALSRTGDLDALGALPMPLADGRTVTGARGVLLPSTDVAPAALSVLGLRVAHPDLDAEAHEVLLRLGAREMSARSLLDDARVRDAVAGSYDAEDPEGLVEAVLGLVRAAGLRPGDMPGLAYLELPADDGDWYPAGQLLLPAGPLAAVVGSEGPFGRVDTELVERFGPDVLRAAGVLSTFALLRDAETVLDPEDVEIDLDGAASWMADILDDLPPSDIPDRGVPPALVDLVAVRDLELVDPDRWPTALRLLAEPPLRDAVLEPARVRTASGRTVEVEPYTRWWLSRHPVLAGPDGRRTEPRALRAAGSDVLLVGLYEESPALPELDATFLGALGLRTDLASLLAGPGGATDLLDRLADPGREVPRAALSALYGRLIDFLDGREGPLPQRLRAVRADRVEVVDADEVVVVDSPDLLPLVGGRAVLPVPLGSAAAAADVLDLALASELVAPVLVDPPGKEGSWEDVPALSGALARLRAGSPPRTRLVVHQGLVVEDADRRRVRVGWRCIGDADHVDASAGAAALGRALAWRVGRWERRQAAVAALEGSDGGAVSLLEDDLEG